MLNVVFGLLRLTVTLNSQDTSIITHDWCRRRESPYSRRREGWPTAFWSSFPRTRIASWKCRASETRGNPVVPPYFSPRCTGHEDTPHHKDQRVQWRARLKTRVADLVVKDAVRARLTMQEGIDRCQIVAALADTFTAATCTCAFFVVCNSRRVLPRPWRRLDESVLPRGHVMVSVLCLHINHHSPHARVMTSWPRGNRCGRTLEIENDDRNSSHL